MKNGYKNLVRYCLNKNLFIRVESIQGRTDNYRLIIKAIETAEECALFIFEKLENGTYKCLAWAHIFPLDSSPNKTVIDYSDNEFMENWCEQFYSDEY